MAFPRTTEVSENFKEKINWWQQYILENINFQQLKLQKKHWLIFILYWMVFDAYLTELSQCDQDKERLKHFFENDSDFKDYITNKKISAKELKNLSPIMDMRPNSNAMVRLNDENNLKQVIEFIYQIRCNLFHGAKNIKSARDDSLVREGAKYLASSIGGWVKGE